MSLLNRRTLLMLPLALAACGFTPVYGPGGNGTALYGQVTVQAPEEIKAEEASHAYLLVRELEERLGRAGDGSYKLDLEISTNESGQAITTDNEIARYALTGAVEYTLKDSASDKVLLTGRVNNFTGYSASGNTVETLAGERDAYERLMTILAEQITIDLLTAPDLTTTDPA